MGRWLLLAQKHVVIENDGLEKEIEVMSGNLQEAERVPGFGARETES